MKSSTLIARICEDYTDSIGVTIKNSVNLVTLIFDFDTEDLITYRIKKSFYDLNLKSIFEDNDKKNKFFSL